MAKKVTDVVEKKVDVAEVAKVVEKKAAKVAEKTAKVVEKAAEKTEKVAKEAVKETKKAVKKTADAAKKAAKPAKTEKTNVSFVLQFAGKEVNTQDILSKAMTQFAAENKAEVKDVTLYVKPEENAAYYVVNGEFTGKVEL